MKKTLRFSNLISVFKAFRLKKFSNLINIILSLLVFIVIPIEIAISFQSRQMLLLFEKDSQNTEVSNLKLVEDNNDNTLKAIISNTTTLATNPLLEQLVGINTYDQVVSSSDNANLVNQITSFFCDSIFNITQIDSMYLYQDNTDYIITTGNGVVRENDFYDNDWFTAYRQFAQSDNNEMCISRKMKSNAIDRNQATTSNVITYFFKLSPISSSIHGVLVVNIHETDINNQINSHDNLNGLVYIVDEHGTIVTYNNDNFIGRNIAKSNYCKKIAAGPASGNFTENGSNGQMFYTYVKSGFSGWTYIKAQSLASITEESKAFTTRWTIISDVIMAIGLFITFLMIYRLYTPLRQLMRELAATHQVSDSGDEFNALSTVYKKMSEQQQLLKKQLDTKKDKFKDLYIVDLLKGNAGKYGKEEIPDEITFPYDRFATAMIAIDSSLSNYSVEQKNYFLLTILKLAQIKLNKTFVSYPVQYTESTIGIVINIPGSFEKPYEALTARFREIMQEATAEIGISISVGIGLLRETVQMVPESGEEAKKALDRRMLTGKNSINLWEPKIGTLMKFYYPYDSEERILNAFSANNPEAINNELEKLAENIRNMPELSSNNIINIFNQLIASSIKDMIDSNINVSNIFGNINKNYIQLASITTLDEIIVFMKAFFAKACEYCKNKLDASSYFDKIVAYFKQNYKHDINFEDMAGEIGISYSYLRKIVKDNTEKTVLEYLAQLRIEEAKHLLSQTNWTAGRISESVGFGNVQSFNRYFKKIVGITASEFRKTIEKG